MASSASQPPEAWASLVGLARTARRPLDAFLRVEAASGILLLVSAAIALVWANSPWAESYTNLWQTTLGVRVGTFSFERSLDWFVNDGLMVIFFLVVGLEIKGELHHGELSEWRRAALPFAAALGGMLVPAGLYLSVAGGGTTGMGWGVPMATDIAFAVGVMALLGNRVPVALRVALLALAVIDDLGAILVIAVFYSSGVAASGLLAAALGIVGVLALQRFGVRSKVAYIVPGAVIWVGIYSAGVHPTIAGVILGLLTPVQAWLGPEGFVEVVRRDLDEVVEATAGEARRRALAQTLDEVDHARREALSPAESLIHKLHGWVAFGIMPIFALANAGVSLSGAALDADAWRVLSAVILGLVVGKPVGVLVAVWLTVRLRIGTLPAGLGFPHILVLGVVAGIGFTMSIFVAQLAFEHPRLLAAAKLGVLVASAVAGVLGLVLGRLFLKTAQPTGAQEDVTP